MLGVPSNALNFETVPKSLEYEHPNDLGYFTLSIIYDSQKDPNILEYFKELQSIIRQRVAPLGLSILDTPQGGTGLYVYQPSTIHCSLIDEKFDRQPTFDEVVNMDFSAHSWLNVDLSRIKPFKIQPKWFFAFPESTDPNTPTTCSFSIQIHIERNVMAGLNREFKGTPKVYPTGIHRLVRGATILARFLSYDNRTIGNAETVAIGQLFQDLHSTFRDPRSFMIDRLSVVKSDSWLSNPNAIVKTYQMNS